MYLLTIAMITSNAAGGAFVAFATDRTPNIPLASLIRINHAQHNQKAGGIQHCSKYSYNFDKKKSHENITKKCIHFLLLSSYWF